MFEFVVVCFDKWWLQSVFFFFFLMANGNILELKLNVYLLYIFTEVEIIEIIQKNITS